MKIKIRKIDNHCEVKYATAGSAGFDLKSRQDLWIRPNEIVKIPCGIHIEIPDGYAGDVRPRSGLSMDGLVVISGTIDSDYRGEINVIMHNVSRSEQRVYIGQRIAQMLIIPFLKCEFDYVFSLSDTDRGSGGFGSTGK
jgi:dUTP pyrophosphatase